MTAAPVPPLSTKRERLAWYLYDFGNSAYASVVYLAVFSTYFKNVVVGGAEGSRLWGLAIGIALVIVALIAPVLGAMADFSGAKKRFLLGFTAQAITFTGLLFFVQSGDVMARHVLLYPGRDRLPQLAGLLRRLPARAGAARRDGQGIGQRLGHRLGRRRHRPA